MKNSILMGTLVVAMALLPSLASATNTAYHVDLGTQKSYDVPGTSGTPPTLSQSTGVARIVSETFNSATMTWNVVIECDASVSLVCAGDIVI